MRFSLVFFGNIIILLTVSLFTFSYFNLHNLIYYTLIILFSAIFSLLLSVLTQFLNFVAELPNEGNVGDFLYHYFWQDCVLRCLAGWLEIIFYIVMFLINAGYLIAGYLILKVVSVWKSERPIIEGRHTAVLRIATILSLFFSYLGYLIVQKL
jgi:hypothetical protein